MRPNSPSYYGYRFPPEMISHAVWLYHRFCLSFRDVEDLLAQRGITVSYEAVRLWCIKFGPEYSRGLKRRQGRLGEKWHLDEVFIKVQGDRQYLWRAVGQEGDVFDILVQPRRDRKAAKRFFRRLFKGRSAPWRLVADQPRSYRVLCQNSALLKQTINQQRSVCVCDRTKGRRLYDRLVSKNTNKLKTRNSKNL